MIHSSCSRCCWPLVAGARRQVAARHRPVPQDPGDVDGSVARYRIVPDPVSRVDRGALERAPDPHRGRRSRGLARPRHRRAAIVNVDQTRARRHLEFPVDSLKSGNPLEDRELQRRIDARRFPTIIGELKSMKQTGRTGALHRRRRPHVPGCHPYYEDEMTVEPSTIRRDPCRASRPSTSATSGWTHRGS